MSLYEALLLDPWKELIVDAPMGAEFYEACSRVTPDINERHRKIQLEYTQAVLGTKEVSEVFMLAVDGLHKDLPATKVLRRRARGFHQAFLRRGPMGLARPRQAISRLRVKVPKRNIGPLSVNEVARFWSSFRTSRDLAIVGLMLLHGLRSAEVLALNCDDVLLPEAQLRVHGKGNKLRFLPLAPETIQLLDHYLRSERPSPCSAALFVVLKGRARGTRMNPAGLRSLFRHHRQTTGIKLAHPHRFPHTFASDMVRAGMSVPALMQLMGHADIQTTLQYVRIAPQDVYLEYARAVTQHIRPLPKTSS
jgi:integrase